ncbi:MAG: phytanoyl-CoA dioxygenase family protein [Alphaproteobacteria bacterium]|nr:phytanoyl-CoA dioxygenase family protein [Alphaproteobacteria bacterium]
MMPTDDDIRAYREDGAVCLRGAVAPQWLAKLAAGVERNLREPGPFARRYTPDGRPGLFFGDYCDWRRIAEYEAVLRDAPLAAIAGRLMGSSKVNLFHEHVLVKEPGTEERTPWHHDQPYYVVDGADIVSLWIPLDPVARATSVEFIAGSHRWGRWYTPRRFADGRDHPAQQKDFVPVPDIEAERDRHRILGWAMAPGDLIAFHGLTLHGAPGNATHDRRRVVSARWTGDDARYVLREGFMSPPPPETDAPAVGAPMDSPVFPVVWRAE